MADLEMNNPSFKINVSLKKGESMLKIRPDETSDGVSIFKCYAGEDMITEIRQDHQQEWSQLWGKLEQEDINRIGAAILKYNS